MRRNTIPDLNLENAIILPGRFRNFSGTPGQYNREGERSFCVQIDDPKIAQQLLNDGWNVRTLQPRNPDDEVTYFLRVHIGYKFRPPVTYMVTNKKKTELFEDTIKCLDRMEIRCADLTIHPRVWNDDGDIKAWLVEMYANVESSRFANKYEDYD